MSDQQIIIEGLRACVFLLGWLSGIVLFGLFGRRWFF